MHQLYLTEKTTLADCECIILARLGFSYEAISARTGLSHSQIAYRLRVGKVSASEYRNGQSTIAKTIIEVVHQDSRGYFDTMQSQIRKYLKDRNPEPRLLKEKNE